MSDRRFVGGPRDGQVEPVVTAVPTGRIPVFRDPPADMVCADEQVIEQIGTYCRLGEFEGVWRYEWIPARPKSGDQPLGVLAPPVRNPQSRIKNQPAVGLGSPEAQT